MCCIGMILISLNNIGMTFGGTHEKSKAYQADLIESLHEPREAEAYLNAALEEEEPELFLLALRNVAEAWRSGAACRQDKAQSR